MVARNTKRSDSPVPRTWCPLHTGAKGRCGCAGNSTRIGFAGPDRAAGDNYSHDAGFADQSAVLVPFQSRPHQSRLNAVELGARVAQAGHFDDCHFPEMKARAGGQPEQIDTARGDVLTHLTG